MSSSHAQGRGLTRNRERLACIECRRRKLKCDRQLPCSACKRRGDPKCVFQRYTNGSKGKSKDVGRQALEERLLRLEQIVQKVTPQRGFADSFDVSASGQGMPPGNGRSRQSQDVDECMDDVINDGVIKGATHWASVWKDIHELRLAITNENDSEPTTVTTITNSSQPNSSSCIGIVFGQTTPMSMNHILAQYLPPRKELDRYISAYFKSQIISASIHAPQFQRLYHRLWEEPLNMPPLWMSILFSMCDIASNSVGSGKSAVDQTAGFPYAAARCLVMGHYYRPQPWGPEALTLFAQARCLSDAILSPDVAPLLCLAAKVATRMGYHRRPETLSMTPFAAEMRRRTWASLTQIDLLTSFHLGLPPSTTVPVAMVDLPRNLNDSDFDEDSLEVPPSRPLEEPTNVQFMIAKQRFMGIFDKILRTALESQQDLVSLNKVQTLHDEVESLFAAMPDKLKPKLMTDSVFDPVNLIITRLCVMFIYAKSLIVLHRPHVLLRRPESIMSCYSSSKMLTEGLCDAYHEFCPGGQVNSDPWFISGLTWHDFMLGAVALCLSSLVGQRSLPAQIDAEATYNLLYNISNICTGQGDTRGNETKRVQQIVEATMTHLRNGQGQEPLQDIGNVNAGNSDAFGEGWLHNMPEPMEDSLWDEYMGQYLNLELLLS